MPKITSIEIGLKLSIQVNDDPWTTKSVYHAAKAEPTLDETYPMAAEKLYDMVATELKVLWKRGELLPRGEAQDAVGDEEIDEPQAPYVDPSWCKVHRCKMKKYTKAGSSWYSHHVGEYDDPSGFWCKGDGAE